MRNRSPVLSILAFGVFGLGALSARSAFADSSCTKDGDCVKGWVCQVTGSSGCGYACAPGTDCPPPPDCGVQDTKSCVPGPCSADSDCASGMVCYTTQVGCDSTPPCAAGADCPELPACQPTTQSACIPRYDAPCKADADCGAGFSCIANQTECNCAGVGSAPGSGADAGAADPVPPPPSMVDCGCPPSTTSSCHALPVTCTTAADCAAGWTCESLPTPGCAVSSPSTPPAPRSNGAPDGGAAPPAQDAGIDPCPPPPPAMKQCMPPYYSLGGGSLGVFGSGQANTTPTSGSSDVGTTPKSPNADSASSDQNSTSAGCSVAHGSGAGSSGIALLALGLFGFLRRRRASS